MYVFGNEVLSYIKSYCDGGRGECMWCNSRSNHCLSFVCHILFPCSVICFKIKTKYYNFRLTLSVCKLWYTRNKTGSSSLQQSRHAFIDRNSLTTSQLKRKGSWPDLPQTVTTTVYLNNLGTIMSHIDQSFVEQLSCLAFKNNYFTLTNILYLNRPIQFGELNFVNSSAN